ncbi:MAG: hypothetical protein JO242_26950 [Streptosporangiaceae bacterium]|nr:hypothetical protein [Streptosporangiaceae bacterium]
MKRVFLAAAGAALAGLTACTSPAAPAAPASAAAARASHGTAAVPVSCSKKYQAWENGPGKGLIAAMRAVSVAGTAGDPQVLTVALDKARPAVSRGASNPVPACADPRGYWDVLLMHVNAAVASRGSASGVRAAMQGVPEIENELTTELKDVSR